MDLLEASALLAVSNLLAMVSSAPFHANDVHLIARREWAVSERLQWFAWSVRHVRQSWLIAALVG